MPRSDDGLILVAHRIPAETTPLGTWLADVADRVVLVTSDAAAAGYAGQFGEVIGVDDYTASNEVVEHLDRLCRTRRVSRIVHGTEDDILRLAQIRQRHGIPGMHVADALVFRDKYRMKVAAATRVRTPAFLAPETPADAIRFAAEVGWPVVVKPRSGFGSRGVAIVSDAGALARELDGRSVDDVLVEAYVPGTVHHVDGFMSEGTVLFAAASRYVNNCLSFADGTSLGSVQLDDGDPVAVGLLRFTEAVVAAMPPTGPTPFHLEVFRHEVTDELYFCEIAARLGGGRIYETLARTIGRDPVELWFRHQAGLPVDDGPITRGPQRYGFLLVPPRAGTLEEVKDVPLPAGVLQCDIPKDLPCTFRAAAASTDTVGSFIISGSSAADVEVTVRDCIGWSQEALRWSA